MEPSSSLLLCRVDRLESVSPEGLLSLILPDSSEELAVPRLLRHKQGFFNPIESDGFHSLDPVSPSEYKHHAATHSSRVCPFEGSQPQTWVGGHAMHSPTQALSERLIVFTLLDFVPLWPKRPSPHDRERDELRPAVFRCC